MSLVWGDNHLLKTCFTRDSLGSRSFATCYGIKVVLMPPTWGRWWMYGWKISVLREPWMSKSFNPESLTPKVCNSQGFDINIVPQSKCVLNFKKYILLRYYLIFFPTSFNISLFTENSWKLLSAICFLIKFLPHSHRQIWLLFYLWGCLGTMWLHSQVQCDWVWWWAWC